MALLCAAIPGSARKRVIAASAAAVVSIAAVDTIFARRLSTAEHSDRLPRLDASVIVNCSPEEVYRFWRDAGNLPRILENLERVDVIDEKSSHWTARGRGLPETALDAEITVDEPAREIAWKTTGSTTLSHNGRITFTSLTGGRGTAVRMEIAGDAPVDGAGGAITALFGQTSEEEMSDVLIPLKQMLETGEIATTRGQPAGRQSGETWLDLFVRG